MGLSGLIGHVGRDYEMIEQGMFRLGQNHGHPHLESAVVGSDGLAAEHLFALQAIAYIAALPVAIVRYPPIGHTTLNLVLHAASLYRHAAIAAGRSLDGERVTVLIVLLHLRKLNVERRTFVFLYTDHLRMIVNMNGEASC